MSIYELTNTEMVIQDNKIVLYAEIEQDGYHYSMMLGYLINNSLVDTYSEASFIYMF